jgi:hypothetical protein
MTMCVPVVQTGAIAAAGLNFNLDRRLQSNLGISCGSFVDDTAVVYSTAGTQVL